MLLGDLAHQASIPESAGGSCRRRHAHPVWAFVRILICGCAPFIMGAPALMAVGASKVDVAHFGAVGDGVANDTGAIQRAIDACARDGGGTVYFPKGRFLTGTIQLKSKVTLYLERGAVIAGSTDPQDYRNLDPFTDGSGNPMGYSLVLAVDASDVGIAGEGQIDGQGRALQLRQAKFTVRPFLVRWVRCCRVGMQGVRLSNPGAWTLNFAQSREALVDRVTIRSRDEGLSNNDGINIDSSEAIRVRHCDVESGDDALVIKSTGPAKSRDIVAEDCRLSTRTNAIKLGTESLGGFEGIAISRCTIHDTGMAGIALYCVDGGDLANVTISDISMRGVTVPISIRLGGRLAAFRHGDRPRTQPGRLRHVRIENVRASDVGMIGVLVNGLPGHPIEDLTLENIEMELPGGGTEKEARTVLPENPRSYPEFDMYGREMPAFALYARHVSNLTLKNFRAATRMRDARPEQVLLDVRRLPAGN